MSSAYNRSIALDADRTPPLPRARRAVIAVLLAEIAVAALVPVLPATPGAVRVAGVNVLWWYAGLVAPVLSVIAVAVIRR